MIDADRYLADLEKRLVADGCEVSHEKSGMVGYKAQLKALTRTHIFLVAAKAGAVDRNQLADFSADAVGLAVQRKGRWGGFQSGVIVLPVLVAESADAGAVAITQRPLRLNQGGFAVLAQPSLVDLAAAKAHFFRGTRIWGYAFNALIKKKLAGYLPDPA
ncbi:hypothetical protein [Actinoplanes sp. NPDC049802]|uniref:hypothetical protein n=1 Tax=Actinoplanes sp. NPDC049802 TaxID=3154742 RepID=UPI00340DBCC2